MELGFLWMSMVGVEGAHDQWQISVLWCCCRHWDIWMYVWLPGPALFSRPVLYVFFLILGCTSGKCLPSTPQYVPQWHFTRVLVRVFVFREMNMCLCRWIEITKNATDQIRGAKCFLRIKLQRDKSWWATRFSFPPCVDDLLCPDSVVLTACLCSFCHTKATSSASAHNCLIPHDAKLELFALLQMNMGILRRVQIAILI